MGEFRWGKNCIRSRKERGPTMDMGDSPEASMSNMDPINSSDIDYMIEKRQGAGNSTSKSPPIEDHRETTDQRERAISERIISSYNAWGRREMCNSHSPIPLQYGEIAYANGHMCMQIKKELNQLRERQTLKDKAANARKRPAEPPTLGFWSVSPFFTKI